MNTDNPFEPGSADSRTGDGAATLEPVEFELGAILNRSFEVAKANLWLVIGAILLPVLITLPFAGIDAVIRIAGTDADTGAVEPVFMLGSAVVNIVSGLVSLFLQLGVIRVFWNIATGRHAEIGMLIGEGGKFVYGFATALLVGLIVLVGFILLIVPGVIAALGLSFALYGVVVHDLGPLEALSESWRVTNGYKLTLFLINLVLGVGALIITCVTCGIGYLAALPILALVQAVMYQSLLHLDAQREA